MRRLLPLALLLLLPACGPMRNPMAEWNPSPNRNPRRPLLIVVHHTASETFEHALKTLQTHNSGGPVSSHYLIGRDGRLAQLVSEDERAWHAGTGTWGPYTDINSLSVGIELDNNGSEPFSQVQIDVLLKLLEDITSRQHIPRQLVVGHADVEPVRKADPSAFFPWKQLAEHGFGLWPDAVLVDPPETFEPWPALQRIGYAVKDRAATLRAFHRHYRGDEGGELDAQDRRILFNLEQKLLGAGIKLP